MARTSVKTAEDSIQKKAVTTRKKTTVKTGRQFGVAESGEDAGVAMIRVPWIGNVTARDFLFRVVDKSDMAHAYGFFGPAHVGKTRMAREIAARMVNVQSHPDDMQHGIAIHPDVVFFDAAEAPVAVAQVRELVSKLSESSLLGGRRVAIIANADLLSRESANTLLKTLEEPRGQTCCILTSSYPEELLPTIISRLARVQFVSVTESEIMSGLLGYGDGAMLRDMVKLSGGAPGRVVALLSDTALRERVLGDVTFWKGVQGMTFVERCVALDKLLGTEKVFGLVQKRVSDLLDVAEMEMSCHAGFAGRQDDMSKIILALIRSRKMLASNAAPKAVMEWFLAAW